MDKISNISLDHLDEKVFPAANLCKNVPQGKD